MTRCWAKPRVAAMVLALCSFAAPAHAATKTGVSAQKISLPSGPGSIEGLGESFEPQLNTGTATYAIKFALPAGRDGVQPQIGIRYNGGAGNGLLGMGWELSGVVHVQRQSDKGLPTYEDTPAEPGGAFRSEDTFVTSDGEELVPLSDGTFRAENEGAFRRYRFDAAANTWTCEHPDGTRLTFGEGTASRIESAAPEGGMRTFRWYVTSLQDTNGNRIEYAYKTLPGSPGMLYPARISYTGHATETVGGQHAVVFTYEDEGASPPHLRPDAFADFRSGFELITAYRLQRVDICTLGGSFAPATTCDDAGVAGAARVAAYRFDYDEMGSCTAPAGQAAKRCARGLLNAPCETDRDCVAGATRLARVTRLGSDNTSTLPPATFAYSDVDIAWTTGDTAGRWESVSAPGLNVDLLGSADTAFVDLDSDGLPDILDTTRAPEYRVWENCGSSGGAVRFGHFEDGRCELGSREFSGTSARLVDSGTQLADLDGDGITDLLTRPFTGLPFRIYPGTARGRFAQRWREFAISGYDEFPPGGFESPEIQFGDLDFDKRMDVVRTSVRGGDGEVWVRLNDGAGLQQAVHCGLLPDVDFANGRTFFTDMNGDRMLDIVVVRTRSDRIDAIHYYPATGRGGFGRGGRCGAPGTRVDVCAAGDCNLAGVEADFLYLTDFFWADVTNDGLSDLVHVGHSHPTVWVNTGGERLRRVRMVPYPDGIRYDSGIDVVRLLDVNGNGTTDIFIADSERGIRFLDFAGSDGIPAHLLLRAANGIGREVEIEYEPSTLMAIRDRDAGRPWRTRLPFPVTVVSRRTVSFGLDLDGAPGSDRYVTEYRYRDGYYDGFEKEFRGFGEVAAIERGDDTQPTLVTRYRFHTGAPDGVDNDGDGLIDERTASGGAEEESLKGQLLEVRRESCAGGNGGECTDPGAIFDHAFSRWEIRRLYTPAVVPKVCSRERTMTCTAPADCDGAGDCVFEDSTTPGRFSDPNSGPAVTSGVPGKTVHFAVNTATRTAVIEQEAAPFANRKDLLIESDFDDFGNRIAERDWGVVSTTGVPPFGCSLTGGVCAGDVALSCGRDADCNGEGCIKTSATDGGAACAGDAFAFTNPAEPDDERFRTMAFTDNTADWLLRHECTSQTADETGRIEAKSRQYYDGLGLCEAAKGNLTLREDWLDTESRWLPRARNQFDQFGNVVETRDARDNRRTYGYDAAFQTYPVSERVHLDGYALTGPAYAGSGCEVSAVPYTLDMAASYHEGFGVVTRATSWGRNGAAGPESRFGYDGFGRLVKTVLPADSDTFPTGTYEYLLADPDADPAGFGRYVNAVVTRKRETAAGGTVDSVQYFDGLGRKLGVKEEGDAPNEWIYAGAAGFNLRGAETVSSLPYSAASSAYEPPDPAQARVVKTYDVVGRVVETIQPATAAEPGGARSLAVYRPLAVDTHDENDTAGRTPGAFVTHESDGLERLVEVIERNLQRCDGHCGEYRTRYSYDARGNLTRILDAQQNIKTIEYDSLGRKTFMNDLNRGHFRWQYDHTDNVTRTEDAKRQVNVYSYDRANRLLTENYLDTTGDAGTDPVDVTYVYDLSAADVDMGDGTRQPRRFVEGYLAAVCDLSGEEHTSYDARRRVEWEMKKVRDPLRSSLLVPYATRFAYDSLDRLTNLIYPDGDRLEYSYGPRGLLDRIAGAGGGRPIVADVRYRPSGQIERCEYGNGVVTTHAYDPRLRLTNLRTQQSALGSEYVNYAYTFDPASNITSITDARAGLAAGNPRRNTQIFAYDDLHRLTGYSLDGPARPDSAGTTITYHYDKIGNMLRKASDIVHIEKGLSVTDLGTMSYGGASGPQRRSGRTPGDQPGPHALTSTSTGRAYPYDDNGNMTLIDGMAAGWDHKDRLVHLDSAEMTADYLYDYTDRRITKKVVPKRNDQQPSTQATAATLYVNRHFEVRDNGQPVKYAWMGATRVARTDGTLDAGAARVQRIDLRHGWNLVGLAVTPEAGDPLGLVRSGTVVEAAYRWRRVPGAEYEPVTASTTLRPGDVLWLWASSPATLSVAGTYAAPLPVPVPAGGSYVAPPWLEALPASRFPASALIWLFDPWYHPSGPGWRMRPPLSGYAMPSDLPAVLAPATPIYVNAAQAFDLAPPPDSAHVQYYHQDHLGSSNVITDDAGNIVEEIAYYPYGEPRYRFGGTTSGLVPTRYMFTQKERDEESMLGYHQTRYLSMAVGRFASVDRATSGLSLGHRDANKFTLQPQTQNPYSYSLPNPTGYIDPDGTFSTAARAEISLSIPGTNISFAGAYGLVTGDTVDGRQDMRHLNSVEAAAEKAGAKNQSFGLNVSVKFTLGTESSTVDDYSGKGLTITVNHGFVGYHWEYTVTDKGEVRLIGQSVSLQLKPSSGIKVDVSETASSTALPGWTQLQGPGKPQSAEAGTVILDNNGNLWEVDENSQLKPLSSDTVLQWDATKRDVRVDAAGGNSEIGLFGPP